jgi:hypothetical protein
MSQKQLKAETHFQTAEGLIVVCQVPENRICSNGDRPVVNTMRSVITISLDKYYSVEMCAIFSLLADDS